MKIAVLGNEGSWYVRDLARAAEERGHDCRRIDFPQLVSNVETEETSIDDGLDSLNGLDAVIVRTMPPGSLEQVVYRMDVLQRLEACGVQVLNPPKAIEFAVDKFLTTSRLAADGLPVPHTIVCEASDQALGAFETLGGDVVVKPLFGAEGRGILRVSDPDLALRVFRTLERINAVLYLQKFIPHAGFDLRVLVLDGAVIGGIRRSHPTDFRTNVARQGAAEPYVPTPGEQELSLAAAKAVEACFAGVDLLYDASGECFVIEVNAVPGWQAFRNATGIDVAGRVMDYIQRNNPQRSLSGT